MKFPFKTIALIGKYKTPEITESLLRLAAFLTGKGVAVVVDTITADHLKGNPYRVVPLGKMEEVIDLAIVLGGDGHVRVTVGLRCNRARMYANHR